MRLNKKKILVTFLLVIELILVNLTYQSFLHREINKEWIPLKEIYKDKVKYCTSIDEALKSADVAFIFTDWQDIKKYPIQKYRLLMKKPLIYDGRNCYDINKVKKEQIEYISIGR